MSESVLAKVYIIGTHNGRISRREWHGTYAAAWAHLDAQSRQLELANYSVRWDSDNERWEARRIQNGTAEVITVKAVQAEAVQS